MKTRFFSLKIDSVELNSLNANLTVSSPINKLEINKLEINKLIAQKLVVLKLRTDLKAINYVIRDYQLYAEGWAYENVTPSLPDLLFSSLG